MRIIKKFMLTTAEAHQFSHLIYSEDCRIRAAENKEEGYFSGENAYTSILVNRIYELAITLPYVDAESTNIFKAKQLTSTPEQAIGADWFLIIEQASVSKFIVFEAKLLRDRGGSFDKTEIKDEVSISHLAKQLDLQEQLAPGVVRQVIIYTDRIVPDKCVGMDRLGSTCLDIDELNKYFIAQGRDKAVSMVKFRAHLKQSDLSNLFITLRDFFSGKIGGLFNISSEDVLSELKKLPVNGVIVRIKDAPKPTNKAAATPPITGNGDVSEPKKTQTAVLKAKLRP
jgi:hypothetical protein